MPAHPAGVVSAMEAPGRAGLLGAPAEEGAHGCACGRADHDGKLAAHGFARECLAPPCERHRSGRSPRLATQLDLDDANVRLRSVRREACSRSTGNPPREMQVVHISSLARRVPHFRCWRSAPPRPPAPRPGCAWSPTCPPFTAPDREMSRRWPQSRKALARRGD